MNVPPDNIIVNSCEYTPVYLIPSTSVTQAGSYIITQSSQDAPKPVSDNLKTFYENSGNLESSLLSSPKPRILKKQSASVVGNNLKLASFLLPKTETVSCVNTVNIQNVTKQVISPVSNVIVKPVVAAVTPVTPVTAVSSTISTSNNHSNNHSNNNVDHTVPRVEIDRKIVRVGAIPPTTRTNYARFLPKNKPNLLKEKTELKIDPSPSKHTSVQLIKLGETYHSLNQLSDEQMKIVNKALKMFSDPEKIPKEPAYDPVTNTKFIYKVVSPKDLTVVGRNKVNMNILKKKHEAKKQKVVPEPEPVEPKVTRSGRTVKLPKQMRPGPRESPQKPKKKVGSVVNCFQCSAEFCSFYRLQRHYEMYPTHIPARIHSNLFHCLLAIIKGSGTDDQANIFLQQLEQLIEKLKTLLPCLLKRMDGKDGKLCTMNDDIARLFGLNPGKYNLNMDALNCIKDKDGHCIHNPAQKNNFSADVSKPSQLWLSKHNEELANNEAETEDCARINSVDKWPTVTKRFWKLKKQKINAKKMRLTSETDQPIELVMEDAVPIAKTAENCAIRVERNETQQTIATAPTTAIEVKQESEQVTNEPAEEDNNIIASLDNQTKLKTHAQFHSTHFDIRSSPIKLPSALARKFQFNPEKLTRLEVQILRPLETNNDTEDQVTQQPDNNFQEIFKDNVELPKETEINNELSFDHAKNWELPASNETSQDSFIKSSILFEPSLTTPIKRGSLIDPSLIHVDDKDLFKPSPKTSNLIENDLLHVYQKSNSLIEHSLLHEKTDDLFVNRESLLQVKDQPNGFYEPSSKPKCNSLIGSSMLHIKDKSFGLALSNVKNRSIGLFDTSLLPINKGNNLVESLIENKDGGFFQTTLEQAKDRSSNLFDSSLIDMKDKDSLIDPTLLLKDDNSSLFIKDNLMEQPLEHGKVDSLMNQSLMDNKNDARTTINIDVNHGDSMNASDSRLLSNQGQSVLNFLESLGNESLGLAYPETEIRNNSVDFQLDLFSFNNS